MRPAIRVTSLVATVLSATALGATVLGALSGCAGCPVKPSQVPASLRVPEGQTVLLEARAKGVQIYECTSSPDATPAAAVAFSWKFVAPEAQLINRWGRTIGRHGAGPSWELQDGSGVVGEVVARDPGPDPAAIPWLLLSATHLLSPAALPVGLVPVSALAASTLYISGPPDVRPKSNGRAIAAGRDTSAILPGTGRLEGSGAASAHEIGSHGDAPA